MRSGEPQHTRHRRLVERHFQGAISLADERELRAHLVDCETCRRFYDRQLRRATLDPALPRAEERLGRPLGLASRPAAGWVWATRLAAAGAAALLMVAVLPRVLDRGPHGRATSDFTARGLSPAASPRPESSGTGVTFHRIAAGAAPAPLGDDLDAADELVLSYRNAAARARLLVFGIDEHRHVFWYLPRWTDPAAEPQAAPIEQGAGVHEVRTAVSHALDGQVLTLMSVFTDRAWTVKEVERLTSGGAEGRPGLAERLRQLDHGALVEERKVTVHR
jgi:hypothetical protein